MRSYSICLCLILLSTTHTHAAEPDKREITITDADSVFAIYKQNHGFSVDGRPPDQLIFAAWPDGRIIWSEHPVAGGPPYRAGKIAPDKLRATFAKLQKDGYFKGESLSRPHFGPDSQTTVIQATFLPGALKMESWHELAEADGKVVATSNGLIPLAGQTRCEVLLKEPHDYIFYRFAWDELRLAAAGLIPSESKPTDGKLEFRKGGAVWVESPPAAPKQDAADGDRK